MKKKNLMKKKYINDKEKRSMNKWLITNGEILNLNRVNRIFYEYRNDYVNWVLWVDFDDELIKICVSNGQEIKRKFSCIKYFLLSSDEIMELKD